jgi:hypothetical protein
MTSRLKIGGFNGPLLYMPFFLFFLKDLFIDLGLYSFDFNMDNCPHLTVFMYRSFGQYKSQYGFGRNSLSHVD